MLLRGTRLGPYEVIAPLGSGGMGEVYRARDPRLARDVAVKVIATEGPPSAERLRRFEDEARAVASLSHPNVLTIFDVGEQGGEPYVVFELLEGETLRERLRRGPLSLCAAVETGVQVCGGLQAAHARGILHRDLKPENVFLTLAGFAKILDFGLAKLNRGEGAEAGRERTQTAAGVVMGTVGYLSPEQARGQEADARSDVFAVGAILYEALSGRRAFAGATAADTISAILHGEPPPVQTASGPVPGAVERILRRCLAKEPADRFHSAHDLGLALEAALAAPVRAASLQEVEERGPYPGLSSFTETDAAHFFGREAEVRALWRRLQDRKLLAVIAPSGTGKTSFVRAGIIAAAPEGWRCAWVTPGSRPFAGLVRALVPELSSDPETLQRLVGAETNDERVAAIGEWRRQHGDVLLAVDQLEELFTLNPREVQEGYAALVGRLASEADVHVLVSLRDDFLMRSQEQPPLRPILGDLTALLPLSAEALQRALVEPAKKRGYAFEDEALVREMVESVEGARGALPLLAFAVSRLWEKRDREKKVLTRAAYEEIGGVAGALAQHAEATMDRIGAERQSVVREIIRNLATAQGTRAVVEREELLSAFPEKKAAEEVLRELIDARLVTSYEVEGREGEPSHHRVEVVHESLLKAWPRLVRWQAQDEEGAVLRDQLKQAAHLWEEKGRTSDLLWTGTAFREYELWRERYPGALTALEEDFARSMAEKARRQKRLVTAGVASVVVVLAGVAIAVAVSRHEAVLARERAEVSALRAEASKVLALGKLEIDRYPTAALAYTRKSLELFDTPEARRFALEVLWRGPVARILPLARVARERGVPDPLDFGEVAISPDGRWLASQCTSGWILLFPRDGGAPRALPPPLDPQVITVLGFGPNSDVLVAGGAGQSVRLLSVPELREIRSIDLGGIASSGWVNGEKLVTLTRASPTDRRPAIRAWPLAGGTPRTLLGAEPWEGFSVDPAWTRLAYLRGREIFLRPLDSPRPPADRLLGRVREALVGFGFVGEGDRLLSADKTGEIRLWPLDKGAAVRLVGAPEGSLAFRSSGRHVAVVGPKAEVGVWDLRDPPDAEPAPLKTSDPLTNTAATLDASGRWLVTNFTPDNLYFWPLSGPFVRKLHGKDGSTTLAVSPDSRWLASCAGENVRVWPLDPASGDLRTLLPSPRGCWQLAAHPAGTHVAVGTFGGELLLYPVAGGPARSFPTGWEGRKFFWTGVPAFDAKGRRVVACVANPTLVRDPAFRVLRTWDLESGRARSYSLAHLTDSSWGTYLLRFAADGRLYAAGQGGVFRLTLPGNPEGRVSSETLYKAAAAQFDLSRDGRRLAIVATQSKVLTTHFDELLVFDLATGTSRRITTHGQRLSLRVAFDATGKYIVTGDVDGVVRIGPVTGEEPHLLLGDMGLAWGLAVSPDGRWVAAVDPASVRIWPMPDMTEPPLHALPHTELLAKLDSLTNLRVVPDPSSSTGWKLDVGPFPGWKDVPTW